MRAMVVEVGFEIQQLVFEIGGCPEQRAIQALPAEGADQPLHEWMGQRNVGHRLDFSNLQDSQIGVPLMKTIQRVVVGTEIFGHPAVASDGVVEHPAKGGAVHWTRMNAKPNDPTAKLIHDDQHPVRPQGRGLAAGRSRLQRLSFIWPIKVSQDGPSGSGCGR